jgi:histidinol-phosphate aminotransferase
MTGAGTGAGVGVGSTASFNAATIDSPGDVRLHLSENPRPFTPAVRAAVLAELERGQLYPDPESTVLRERVASFHDLDPSMVVVGNGCDELVLLTALALVGPRGHGVTSAATFPGYRTAMSLLGATVAEVPLRDDRCDLEALAAAAVGSAAVYLCNPHNPTGSAASRPELRRFLEATSAAGAVPVVDEAYLELAGEGIGSAVDFIREGGAAIALRTMSKAYGLAGLRVGFALGPAALIARLTRAAWALPFRVNRLAQVAAIAALEDQAQLRATCRELRATRDRFCRDLDELGLAYLPSETNFVMVRTPGDSGEATRRLEASHHLLVRDCGPFGLPGWIRISMGSPSDMSLAVAALGAVCTAPGKELP